MPCAYAAAGASNALVVSQGHAHTMRWLHCTQWQLPLSCRLLGVAAPNTFVPNTFAKCCCMLCTGLQQLACCFMQCCCRLHSSRCRGLRVGAQCRTGAHMCCTRGVVVMTCGVYRVPCVLQQAGCIALVRSTDCAAVGAAAAVACDVRCGVER